MYKRLHTEEWDFKNANTKEFTHGYHSYPAMMIPQIARKLITEFAPSGRMELLFDPRCKFSNLHLVEEWNCYLTLIWDQVLLSLRPL